MIGDDEDGSAVSRLEARLDHLEAENRRLRKTVQARATCDMPPYSGDRSAQRKAEATWARRIDRITELAGVPASDLPLVFGFPIGIALPSVFIPLGVLLF